MTAGPGSRTFIVGASGWLGADLVRRIRGAVPVQTSRVMSEGARHLATLGVCAGDTLLNASGSKDPEVMRAVNFRVVEALVSFAEGSGARVLQLGSAAEYGLSPGAGRVKESDQEAPESQYGETKLQATDLVRRAGDRGAVLRLFNIVSAPPQRQTPLDDVLARARAGAASERDVEILSARTTRDWVTKGFVLESVAFAAATELGGVFNIASGSGISMSDLVSAILDRLGASVGIRDLAAFAPTSIVGDPSRWKDASGLREQVGADGIARVLLPGGDEHAIGKAAARQRGDLC